MGGTDTVIHPSEAKEKKSKPDAVPPRPGEAWSRTRAVSCGSKPAPGPRRLCSREQRGDRAEPTTSPPLSSRQSQGLRPRARPDQARPAISTPLSARSCARAWICLPALPNFGTFHYPHTVRPQPSASPGGWEEGRGPKGEECTRCGSSPLDGEGARSPLRYRTHPGRPPSWY